MSARCHLCGVALVRVADTRTDEYVWAGPDGRTYGRDPDLAHIPDPYRRLAELSDALLAAQAVSSRKASRTWLYWAMAREYSALKARLEFGGTDHVHWADAAGEPPPYEGSVPECCGWPAWLRPSGWQCRRCRRRLPVPGPVQQAPVRAAGSVQAPGPAAAIRAGRRSR